MHLLSTMCIKKGNNKAGFGNFKFTPNNHFDYEEETAIVKAEPG